MAAQNSSVKPWALVTGASAGIGEATAIKLDQAGYSTVLVARRKDRLEKLQKRLQNESQIFTLDIRSREEVASFVSSNANTLKKVEVLINNAGLAKGTESFQNSNLEDYETMIDTNVKGLIYLTRGLLPSMLENKKGHIVNLGSVAGRWVYPGGSVYCATKFAVRALSEGLRMDLMGTGLKVTNIEPGMVETEFSVVRMQDEEKARRVYMGMTPLKADDIADTVVWCLSRPSHVNIQELVIFPTDQAGVGPSYTHRR